MNQRDDLDRLIDAWTDELYAAPASRILGKVLEETRQTRQRRAWASLERWLPMTVITRPAAAPLPLRLVYLVVVTLLILALAASVAIRGLAAPASDHGDPHRRRRRLRVRHLDR